MSSARPSRPFAGARVAIVHDWLQGMHGAERTVEAMITGVFADAAACDVYTFHAAHDVISPVLSDAVVRDAAVTHLPGLRQRGHKPGHWRYLLPYMPRWFERLRLDGYDVVAVLLARVCRRRAPAHPRCAARVLLLHARPLHLEPGHRRRARARGHGANSQGGVGLDAPARPRGRRAG